MNPYFSVIVPIYNRPEEGKELLESLALQTYKNFELVLVEDGSKFSCESIVPEFKNLFDINYIRKVNTGRSDTRNVGMKHAKGDYLIFFDSDCIIPPQYFEILCEKLQQENTPCFGGPDSAHESFSNIQKAINYAMTSFWTTGGIRGGKINMEKFVPRTFNMGFSKEVYDKVGGFNEKIDYGEDMDISARIRKAGFSIALFNEVFVYHKRRVDFKSFFKQVYNFGYSRIATIYKLYPDTLKLVHFLPAAFVCGSIGLVILSLFSPLFLLPLGAYVLLLFFDSLWKNKRITIAFLSIIACFVQLYGYGIGFLKAAISR